MSAKKKTAKRKVEFGVSRKEKQWNKPQAAAKEMIAAIGQLAKESDDKLGKVKVTMTIDLAAKGTEISGTVEG